MSETSRFVVSELVAGFPEQYKSHKIVGPQLEDPTQQNSMLQAKVVALKTYIWELKKALVPLNIRPATLTADSDQIERCPVHAKNCIFHWFPNGIVYIVGAFFFYYAKKIMQSEMAIFSYCYDGKYRLWEHFFQSNGKSTHSKRSHFY